MILCTGCITLSVIHITMSCTKYKKIAKDLNPMQHSIVKDVSYQHVVVSYAELNLPEQHTASVIY